MLTKERAGGLGWKVLATSAAAVALFSAIQIFVIYPQFIDSAVRECESEAIRDARHMINMIPTAFLVGQKPIDDKTRQAFTMFLRDFQLWKVKLFNAEGEVVYSSDPADIGTVNRHDYFYGHVAQGNVFTKAVWQKEVTLEGQVVPVDVVETYVPIMNGMTFLGAWEIYYDVTVRRGDIKRLISRASLITLAAAGFLLVAMSFLAAVTEGSFREQERLQAELVQADRLAALGTLVGGIAHEFNNINVTVMGFSQLGLEQEGLSPLLRDHLERINRAAQRARTITNNLLDFSRESAGEVARENLVSVVREALDLVKGQFEKEGIEFREALVDVEDTHMDRGQIVQVILNILNNARHAMEGCPEKKLTVVTGSEEGSVFVSITDTGCGIPEERLSDIFTPFYTTKGEHASDERQSKIKGAGLGLSVSHTIVSNHGGRISVESGDGLGTTFSVSLPVNPHIASAAAGSGEEKRDA